MLDKTNILFRQSIVVRFSGDSGDGMQLAGNIFSNVSAERGDQISTFPDYPACCHPTSSRANRARPRNVIKQ